MAAERLFREALALNRMALGEGHPHVATSLSWLSWVLVAKGDHAAAEPLYREALDIWNKKPPPRHIDVANAQAGLSIALLALGRKEESLGPLTASFESSLQDPNTPATSKLDRCQTLVELYEKWHTHKPDGGYDAMAAEWRAKLAQWQASTRPAETP